MDALGGGPRAGTLRCAIGKHVVRLIGPIVVAAALAVQARAANSVAPTFSNGPATSSAIQGFGYTFTFVAAGSPAPTFSVSSGSLPPGLALSSAGTISGTPTAAGVYAGVIDASNGISPDATQAFAINVTASVAPAFAQGPLDGVAVVGSAFSFPYEASGVPAATFTLLSGALPPGLSLSPSGALSGTPTAAGTYTGTVAASNGVSPAATQAFTLVVEQAPAFANPAISWSLAAGSVFSYTYATTGYPESTFAVTQGSLPSGMTLTTAGTLTGSPTQTGIFTGTITASNPAGSASQSFTLTVLATANLTLSLPSTVNEGDADGQGLLTLSSAPSAPVTITLLSSNPGALAVPPSVTVAAGATTAAVPYTIIDNLDVYGNQAVLVTAVGSAWTASTSTVVVTDNKTTDNWTTYGNGPAHLGLYHGSLLGGNFQLAWSANLAQSALNPVAVQKGTVFATPAVYFATGSLTALDAGSGKTLWQFPFGSSSSINPPTVYKGSVYVQQIDENEDGKVYSVGESAGTLNWSASFDTQWANILAPLAYQSIGVWVESGENGGISGFSFAGAPTANNSLADNGYDLWTPTYYQGVVYTWTGDGEASESEGVFSAVNPANGSVLWSTLAPWPWHGWSMGCTVPIVDQLAFLDGIDTLTAISLQTQQVAWSASGSFTGTPAVANGIVYAISGTDVIAFNEATGARLATYVTSDNELSGQPIVASDALVVSSSSATYVFNLATTALVQTIAAGGPVSAADGSLFIAGTDGTLRVYAPTGLDASFASPGTVGLTSWGFTAAGNTFTAALGFDPTSGTVLTAIDNTSSNAITGTFTNLANDASISLAYEGTNYTFVANYSGGDGNDLTLAFTGAPPQSPQFLSSAVSNRAVVGYPYSSALSASGYPSPTFAVATGSLPPGLSLSPAGQLSGTPTQVGTFSGTFSASNASGSASQSFAIVVQPGLALTISLPAVVNAGDPDGTGTLDLDTAAPADLVVTLTSSNTGAITVPQTVTVPAGQDSITFPYTIVDNLLVAGTQYTAVTAAAQDWASSSETVAVTDDKTTDNWSTFGNGPAHTGAYAGSLLGGNYTQLWSSPLGSGALNPVVVSQGIVYATPSVYFNSGSLTALNASSGATLWQYPFASSSSINPPTVYKGSVYVQQIDGDENGSLYSINASSGGLNWTAPFATQWAGYFAPLAYQSIGIWVGGGEYGGIDGYGFNGANTAFDDLGGDILYDGWTPTFYNGVIYVWVGDGEASTTQGVFSAIDPSTGDVTWSVQAPWAWHGWTMGCAAPIDGGIAFLNSEAALTAINLGTHSQAWSVAGTFTGTPAVNQGVVYVLSGSTVMALSASTGATIATLQTNDSGLAGQPLVAQDAIVVSSSSATYIFNRATGTLVQTIPYGGPVAAAGDVLYIAGGDGTLRAFGSTATAASFASAGSVGLSAYGFTASGHTLLPTLGFAPALWTSVTAIQDTGPSAISGVFSNLPDGGTINLAFNGTYYPFVANYEGGLGQDLTLTYIGDAPAAPFFAVQPASVVVAQGDPAVFSATAYGNPMPTYQWYFNGNAIAGATSPQISLPVSDPAHAGTYSVVASNSFGSATSASATLSLTAPPVLTLQPQPATLPFGGQATLTVGASGSGTLAYQWFLNGEPIAGATSPSYHASSGGLYTVTVSNDYGSTSASAKVTAVSRLVNISARADILTGANIAVSGFVVSGPPGSTKQLLLRAVGPELGYFGVPGTIASPQLVLYDSQGTAIVTNTGWENSSTAGTSAVPVAFRPATPADFAATGAFALDAGSSDSAIVVTVPPGLYTLFNAGVAAGGSQSTGIGLTEVYEMNSSDSAVLVNISTRAYVGSLPAQGSIAGFIVGGTQPARVLIRGVGPALAAFGVANPLASPILVLNDSGGAVMATDTGWTNAPAPGSSSLVTGGTASSRAPTAADFSQVGAFSLPAGSADSAMVVTLPPGAYTATVTGANGSTGVALVEVYQMP